MGQLEAMPFPGGGDPDLASPGPHHTLPSLPLMQLLPVFLSVFLGPRHPMAVAMHRALPPPGRPICHPSCPYLWPCRLVLGEQGCWGPPGRSCFIPPAFPHPSFPYSLSQSLLPCPFEHISETL